MWACFFISLPLLYFNGCYEVFALRKTVFIALLAIHVCCWPFLRKPDFIFFTARDLVLPLFFLLRLLSFLFSGAFQEAEFSLETLAFEGSLLLFWWLLRSNPPTKEWFNFICKGLIISCFVTALMQLLALPFIKPMVENRISAQFFHPNVFGILCAALGLRALFWQEKKSSCYSVAQERKIYFWFTPAFISMVFSGSKGAFFAFFLGAAFFCRQSRKILPLLTILLLIAFIPRLLLSPVERYRNAPGTAMTRIAGFKSTLKGIVDNPFGAGPGLFHLKIHPYVTHEFHKFFPHPALHSLNKAHNWPLEIIFESGLLMLPFLLFALWACYRSPAEPNKIMLFTFFIGSLYCVHLNYPLSQIIFTLFLINPEAEPKASDASPPIKTGNVFYLRLLFCTALSTLLFWYGAAYFQAQKDFKNLQNLLKNEERNPETGLEIQSLFIKKTNSMFPVLRLETLYFHFLFLTENENYTAAEKLGRFLQQRFPGYYLLEHYLALNCLIQGKIDDAAYFIEKAIDYHPLDEGNYLLATEIYRQKNDDSTREKALKIYHELKKRNQNFRD
jgi:hypothetical protein